MKESEQDHTRDLLEIRAMMERSSKYNASKYTFEEVRIMGVVQIVLGIAGVWFVQYSLMIWALGFGVVHIIYGIYIHYKYKQ